MSRRNAILSLTVLLLAVSVAGAIWISRAKVKAYRDAVAYGYERRRLQKDSGMELSDILSLERDGTFRWLCFVDEVDGFEVKGAWRLNGQTVTLMPLTLGNDDQAVVQRQIQQGLIPPQFKQTVNRLFIERSFRVQFPEGWSNPRLIAQPAGSEWDLGTDYSAKDIVFEPMGKR